MNLFNNSLSSCVEDIELRLDMIGLLPWSDFWLNPRRLRGSDFLMRWSQGVWSEKRLIEAINKTDDFSAIPYGPSGTAPTDDVRAFELYFERLDEAGLGKIKRPDILIFRKRDMHKVKKLVAKYGGLDELPFIKESELTDLLNLALLAVECENSLWVAKKMPDLKTQMKPQKRLSGKLGLKKNAVLPTIIVKEQDFEPLKIWQRNNKIQIHVWHVFFDLAYGISLDRAQELIRDGLIQPTEQIFQAPGGATTRKIIYKFYYFYGYELGKSNVNPALEPAYIEDKNGHILPYVKFVGGDLQVTPQAIEVLKTLRK